MVQFRAANFFPIAILLCLYLAPEPTNAGGVCYSQGSQTKQLSNSKTNYVKTYYTYTSYYSYSCGWWGWSRCYGSYTVYVYYTYSYTTTTYSIGYSYYQNSFCCSGYTGSAPDCDPYCSSCDQGTCTAPSTCSCNSGWSGSSCDSPVCNPSCQYGSCIAPSTCSCNQGYTGSTCGTPVCSSCVYGTCVAPESCSCNSGWSGSSCSTPVCADACGQCTSCASPGQCGGCNSGWEGPDCCSDINECSTSNGGCEHNCVNTDGSYYCTCKSGYSLDSDGKGCSPICNDDCGYCSSCPSPYNCNCDAGWSGSNCCTDINECSLGTDNCEQGCTNTDGSYTCYCYTGYSLHSNGYDCIDINECALGTDGCNHICSNNQGSYDCSCYVGYELSADQMTCVDTNECAISNGGCNQTCTNSIGSYQCSCGIGWVLNADKHACDDVNECLTNNGGCHHVCINNQGSYKCDCNIGYYLGPDDHQCHDVDECLTNNGGCDQVCVNEVGSFHCECNIGFLLDEDGFNCSDHDECATNVHDCDEQYGICHNTHGSFYCTCLDGFRLQDDGRTCLDIDECAEDISGCNQICNNLVGSYFCTCYIGFYLDTDNHTCRDINECETDNGGCGHICTNEVGSYFCTCRPGYDLDPDIHGCTPQPCDIVLEAPQNGTISCPWDQVTDANCTFTCDYGFTFVGPMMRHCLWNNTWTGVAPYCDIKHCETLLKPPNGYIATDPCDTQYTTVCEIQCVEGYFINDTTPYYQTCAVNTTTNEVYWTKEPVCEWIPPCHSIYSPCKHGGKCTELSEYDYQCDCDGTGYKGSTCTIGVVEPPAVPVINTEQGDFLLSIKAYPDIELGVQFLGPDGLIFNPPTVWIYPDSSGIVSFTVQAPQDGVYVVSFNLTGVNAVDFETPDPLIILAVSPNSDHIPNNYFSELNMQIGQLAPGCCNPGGQIYQCPGSTATVSFTSVCYWTVAGMETHVSDGVVFAEGPGLLLPLSIAGSEITLPVEGGIEVSLPTENLQCEECTGGSDNCYHYKFTVNDIVDFLTERALGKTYLNQSSILMPSWLRLSLHSLPSLSDVTFTNYDYTVSLLNGSQVTSLPGCQLIEVDSMGLYAVLRYHDNITALFEGSTQQYTPKESDLPTCIAIDICQGSLAPVHLSIPAGSQDTIREFPQFQKYVEKGWKFGFYEALVSTSGITYDASTLTDYWNGHDNFVPNIPTFDMRLESSLNADLHTAPNLWLNFTFIGDLYHQSSPSDQEIEGLLIGDITIRTNFTTRGQKVSLKMTTSFDPVVFTLPEYWTNSSTSPSGVSLRLNLNTEPDDVFFSDAFPFPDGKDTCPCDAFIGLTPEADLGWMNIRTICPGLRFSGYDIPPTALNTTVYIAGEIPAQAPTSSYDGADFQVWSNLTTDTLPVNQFFSVRQPANGSAVTVGYWKSDKTVASLKECGISILGTHFTTSVVIDSETGLLFTAEANLFDQFKASLTGSVATGYSWDNFPLQVNGVFSDSYDSFQMQLENYTYSYVATEVEKAQQRVLNALSAVQKTQDQIDQTQAQIDALADPLAAVTDKYNDAMGKVTAAQEEVQQAQEMVDAISSNIQSLVESLAEICPDMDCNSECTPTVMCSLCNNALAFHSWGITPVVEEEDFFDYHNVDELVYEWVNEPAHQNCFQTTIIKQWGQTSFGQNCFDVYRPRDVIISRERSFISSRDVEHMEAGLTHTFNYSILLPCCSILCGGTLQNPTCLFKNAACKAAREPGFDALTVVQQQLLAPTFALNEAQESLIAAQAEVVVAAVEKSTIDNQYNALLSAMDTLQAQLSQLQENYDAIVQQEKPFLDLGTYLQSNSINQLLQLKAMSFEITIEDQSPNILPVTFIIFIPSLSANFSYTIEVDFTITLLSIKRDLAEELLAFVSGKVLQSRKREAIQLPLNYQRFEQNWARLVMLQKYILQVNESVNAVMSSINQAQENITMVISSLLSLIPTDVPELDNINFDILTSKFNTSVNESELVSVALNDTSYLVTIELIHNLVQVLVPLYNAVGSNLFVAWQSAMETIHSKGLVDIVAEENCLGFTDCLTKVGSITQEILEDTPGSEAQDLLMQLPAAKQALLQLGLAVNMNLTDAWPQIYEIFSILTTTSIQNYWSGTPPTITLQPLELVAVETGEAFDITCQAISTLSLIYSWKKDGFVVPEYDTNIFHRSSAIPLDEGKYQCLSTNAVGTTGSILSTVDVHNAPTFTLQPAWFETYENNDDGAWFICNTTGNPVPGYEWYYSTKQSDWELVSNDSNLLYISSPLKSQEGWYRCRTYTEHAEIYSNPVYLTVLGASFSQLVYPVSFELILVSSSSGSGVENGSGIGSGYDKEETMLEDIIYSILSEFLYSDNVGISNVEIGDNNDQGILLVTLDISLKVPYLLNETIADQAKMVAPLEKYLLSAIEDFEKDFTNDTIIFEHNGNVFETKMYSLKIEDQTFACPEGKVLKHNNFICVSCSPGFYQTKINGAAICEPCPVGTYQEGDGLLGCISCPALYSTIGTNSRWESDCQELCSPNEYSSNGFQPCQACPSRSYQLEYGATSCTPCTTADSDAIDRCYVAPPGTSPTNVEKPTSDTGINTTLILAAGIPAVFVAVALIFTCTVLAIFVSRRRAKRKDEVNTENRSAYPFNRASVYDESFNPYSADMSKLPGQDMLSSYQFTARPDRSSQISGAGGWKANPLYMEIDEVEDAVGDDDNQPLIAKDIPTETPVNFIPAEDVSDLDEQDIPASDEADLI